MHVSVEPGWDFKIRWDVYGHAMVIDFVEKDEFGIYASVLEGAPVECSLQMCDTGEIGVVIFKPSDCSPLNHFSVVIVDLSVW
ncbi:hypothetical protein DPMN_107161 [Dreissena polymorpha]|uniref:Uncharacterized protein n=1 Tax=Dreissena polymorpha TaxID=45954 RepID=A0A9D4K6F6_DREPO|nr:hypothetical protein DPMN_107161 [Dreissena polymorpha]